MTTRPKQHWLEDQSRISFQQRLPPEWVWRDKDKDYGIDGEVEIFDKNGQATGLIFLVQLKATASAHRKTQRTIRIPRKTLRYYERLTTPVLLVRWIKATGELYVRWSDRILRARERTPPGKTLSVSFSSEHQWTESTPHALLSALETDRWLVSGLLHSTIPLFFHNPQCKIGDMTAGGILARLRGAAEHASSTLQVIRERSSPCIEVQITRELVLVYAGTLRLSSFGGLDDLSSDYLKDTIGYIALMTIGLALFEARRINAASELIQNIPDNVLTLTQAGAQASATVLCADGHYDAAFQIARSLTGDSRRDLDAQMIRVSVQFAAGNWGGMEAANAVEDYLRTELELSAQGDDSRSTAVCHYNLASFLRSTKCFPESFREYKRAAQKWSAYRDRSYFWSEVGGVLYLLGRYGSSVESYRKSYALAPLPQTKALEADALMAAGRYSESADAFNTCLSQEPAPEDEWILKSYFVNNLANEMGMPSQSRQVRQAEAWVFSNLGGGWTSLDVDATELIDFDALNADGWQIISEHAHQQGEPEKRAFAGLAAALFARGVAIQLWFRALVYCGLSQSLSGAFPHIVRLAYEFFGERFLTEFHDGLENVIEERILDQFLSMCDEIVRSKKQSTSIHPNEKTIRLWYESGEKPDQYTVTVSREGSTPQEDF